MNEFVRYAFFGTGIFAARCLELLSEWKLPSWVVTAAPKPSGRGGGISRTPVGELARGHAALKGVPLAETGAASSDGAVLALKKEFPVDFSFVTDFGQLIKEPLLSWDERVGCLNIHPSELPRYRGAAPIQRAVLDGADAIGVSVFKLAARMDSGPVLLKTSVPVLPDDDFGSLRERAAEAGVSAFVALVSEKPLDLWTFVPQDESLATCAPKISADEERVDWKRSAGEIVRLVRALSPSPGAWTTLRGKRLRILSAREAGVSLEGGCVPGELRSVGTGLEVAAGAGRVELLSVQAEGKKPQPVSVWKNGLRAARGECLV
jgi:methionyl-tRNA formyltransferase